MIKKVMIDCYTDCHSNDLQGAAILKFIVSTFLACHSTYLPTFGCMLEKTRSQSISATAHHPLFI